MSPPKSGDKLSPEDFAQHFDRQEERVLRMNPPRSVRRDSATRNNAVNVGMKQQVLPPRMKDAEEANLGSQMLGVPCDVAKRFSDDSEQQMIELGLVLENERV